MIRISKLTDYAFVVLLSLEGVRFLSAADLARQTHIPEPTVAKLLKVLTQAGLVHSERGPKGGYRRNKDPAQISVGEVIEIFEGPISLTDCAGQALTSQNCSLHEVCELSGKWRSLNKEIRDLFYARRIASLDQRKEDTAMHICPQTDGDKGEKFQDVGAAAIESK